ncbi:glutathione S-transferase [Sordaria brevicollis]|uniref:Glutathione S-transferase n=1 Tax=Sordaria brevicollis TaxID=83679 RepID=A0AAE0P9V9_SORBR|nr:glutathione S-transferase [Sordaria brevicollis]
MPRNGDGSSDNAIETGNNIIHGAGEEPTTRVARADKTAPLPEHEEGQAIKGLNASGGPSQGLAQGPEAGQGGGSMHATLLKLPRTLNSFTKPLSPSNCQRYLPTSAIVLQPRNTMSTNPSSSSSNISASKSSVDTSLQGSPTGAAATFAAQHSSEHPLKLYGGWFCPFVQRVWITLAEKDIPHQYIEINPYHKAPEFLALNPRGLVPTLAVPTVTDAKTGKVKEVKPLYESLVLCEYLDEAFPNNGERLLPQSDPYERARCRLWIDHISSRIVPSFYRFIQHTPDKPYSLEEIREEFLGHLKTFAKEMLDSPESRSGPFFLGERFSLVDIMLVPWAKRLFLIDHYKSGGVGIPAEGHRGEDEKVWKRWEEWYDAVTERESVKKTWSEDEQYVGAYKRYAEDTTQSAVGKATRSGRSLP